MQRISKTIKIIIVVALLAALTIIGLVFFTNTKGQEQSNGNTSVTSVTPPSTNVQYVAIKGQTILAQLLTKAEVVTKDSSYGTFVDSINGVRGGTDGKYWVFYVDGKMADKGADAYVAVGGEVIEWKFEK